MRLINLGLQLSNGGSVSGSVEAGYAFNLPGLPKGSYGLAQVDDYRRLPRGRFPHQPPLRLSLEARASATELPGTWGFGLWNDPFSFVFGGGGMARLLPVLPNTAWFFYGSQENHLTLRDDLPGAGFQAKTFQSPRLPAIISLLAFPGLPLLFWPVLARWVRRLGRTVVKEEAKTIKVPVDGWHAYSLEWTENGVAFIVDGELALETSISPGGRLGLVIWIDNQYFKFSPDGSLGFGFLQVDQPGWLQVRNLGLEQL